MKTRLQKFSDTLTLYTLLYYLYLYIQKTPEKWYSKKKQKTKKDVGTSKHFLSTRRKMHE